MTEKQEKLLKRAIILSYAAMTFCFLTMIVVYVTQRQLVDLLNLLRESEVI